MELKKVYPHGYHKTDKLGRPIYIEIQSKIDLKKVFKVTSEERIIKFYIKEYERLLKYRLPACSTVANKIIEQSLTIIDVEGLGISLVTGEVKKFLKLAANVGQNYYPEMLGQMVIINSGFFFKALWTIVRGFIDEKTVKKIIIEKSKYKEKLLELIDEENLPSFLGGSCTCSHIDGGCLYADIGPWNPEGGLSVDSSSNVYQP
jgi:hypothetical protein